MATIVDFEQFQNWLQAFATASKMKPNWAGKKTRHLDTKLVTFFKDFFLTSMNRSMLASVGRSIIKNLMFLYSISAGSGRRVFITLVVIGNRCPQIQKDISNQYWLFSERCDYQIRIDCSPRDVTIVKSFLVFFDGFGILSVQCFVGLNFSLQIFFFQNISFRTIFQYTLYTQY